MTKEVTRCQFVAPSMPLQKKLHFFQLCYTAEVVYIDTERIIPGHATFMNVQVVAVSIQLATVMSLCQLSLQDTHFSILQASYLVCPQGVNRVILSILLSCLGRI